MVTISEVKSRKDKRLFLKFPMELYHNNPYYVPNLYLDEKNALNHKTPYEDTCESIFFLAIRNKKVVGRIQGVIQKEYNALHKEKRVRFTRFDAIDDKEVSRALFKAVEDWAKKKGMDTFCGPLGYSDFEREGLLIEGFDQRQTFEEQYNYDYYQNLVEDYGFQKEIDWVESILRKPEREDETLPKVAQRVLERNHLHLADIKMGKKKFIKRYGNGFFDCIDESYKALYGTVPFTPKMRKLVLKVFFPLIDLREAFFLVDDQDKIVSLGIMFPGISDVIRKSKGHLTPLCLISLLKVLRKPKILDLGLIAVLPEYKNSGILAVGVLGMIKMFDELKLDHMETNLNLETNKAVRNLWKRFSSVENKRRRSFVKSI